MMWLNFCLYAALFIVFGEFIQWLLRRFLKVERKKFFSYNYVNDLHKKMDRVLRTIVLISSLIAIFFTASNEYSPNDILVFLLFFNLIPGIGTFFFEWKYSPTRKQSILTICEIVYIVIVVVTIIEFDLLDLLIKQL